jgi:hypothetical protein
MNILIIPAIMLRLYIYIPIYLDTATLITYEVHYVYPTFTWITSIIN